MTIGLTSSLTELVQKAIEIESNIAQQKIDDKLCDAHKEDNINKQKSATVNNLFNTSQPNPLSLTTSNEQNSYNNYNNNSKYNNNHHNHSSNKYSRTFINSTTSPRRSTQTQVTIGFIVILIPNGRNYQVDWYRRAKQQQPHQGSISSSHYSQQQYSNPPHNYELPNQRELIHQQQP
ncbi:unnamed protein product [Rotaria sp. Silwood1]|nr:unnamed protein product [Rotaria sp. Silwood1]CAF3951459.1 unnamed protein product [Rotaria sp. Silwood1]CAF4995200.1 unnamed protein product [Rotaria sp. Silwood1]CAF4998122.1 unnamed protein product [Rotaria sp. Silwood1]CAF5102051.1 unnamed protein product [Rotaria sp. Silwood1]